MSIRNKLNYMDRIYMTHLNMNEMDKIFSTGAKFATGDLNTSILLFKLTLDNTPMDVSNCTIYANILKKDDTVIMNDCEIVDLEQCIIGVDLDQQAVVLEGEHIIEIVIHKAGAEKLVSPKATYHNYLSIEGQFEILESESAYPILTKLIEDVKNTFDDVILHGTVLKFYADNIEKASINLPTFDGGAVDLSPYQRKVDKLLNTNSKEVVGAINENFDSINEFNSTKLDKVELVEDRLVFYANEVEKFAITLESTGGSNGVDGREVELSKNGTHIQWRYVGEDSWIDLVSLAELKGDTGATGSAGRDGQDGADGANGKSAYEIWLEQGNQGNESAFLASLKGQKGDTGNTGSTGATGAKGDTGKTPNITIGTVTTLEPTQQATVTKRGTAENPVFDFGIPKGERGDSGESGGSGNSANINDSVISTSSTWSSKKIDDTKANKNDVVSKESFNTLNGQVATHLGDNGKHLTNQEQNIQGLKIFANGATFTGTAREAGLKTRGVSGLSTNGLTKDCLYLNYDGNEDYIRYVYISGTSDDAIAVRKDMLTWENIRNKPELLKGDKGDTGEAGSDGKSAYEIWLEQDNSGSESEFLASLKGQKGDKGNTGATGAKGDSGVRVLYEGTFRLAPNTNEPITIGRFIESTDTVTIVDVDYNLTLEKSNYYIDAQSKNKIYLPQVDRICEYVVKITKEERA